MALFGLLFSIVNVLLGFIFRTVIIRFVLFFGLLFVAHEFIYVLSSWIPFNFNIPALFRALPAPMWYFFDLFKFSEGFQLVFNAYITRFIIRRIPIIG
ncbi:DUF2523 family protein [Escherichia coli]